MRKMLPGLYLSLMLLLGFGMGVYWHAFHDWDRPDGAEHRALRCEYAKERVRNNLAECYAGRLN